MPDATPKDEIQQSVDSLNEALKSLNGVNEGNLQDQSLQKLAGWKQLTQTLSSAVADAAKPDHAALEQPVAPTDSQSAVKRARDAVETALESLKGAVKKAADPRNKDRLSKLQSRVRFLSRDVADSASRFGTH